MALSTYSELQTALSTYLLHGAAVTTAMLQDFIRLCEADMNVQLRTRWQETSTDLTPNASGVATLPSDFLEARSVVAETSPRTALQLLMPEQVEYLYPDRSSGTPAHYMLVGETLSVLPVSTTTIELNYYKKIPALTDSATTNWVLTNFPQAYLFGSLMQAGVGNTANEQFTVTWAQGYAKALNDIRSVDNRARYSRSAARISGPTP